jgi:hypothetical protein
MHRRLIAPLLALGLAAALTGCLPAPGSTNQVVQIDSRDVNGWHFDYFENRAYPCSIRGYQTFAIGTKIGSSAAAARPLWVKMRGGGVGWFSDDGTPQPTAGQKSEVDLTRLLTFDDGGLTAKVKAAPEGFRLLLVSMCSHDIYGGTNQLDPHNPYTTPDGKPRRTNGLISTKAAIQYARAAFPTTKFFLHGTSAGGAGTFNVAYGLQQQGLPPAGLISDSGVVDVAWQQAVADQGTCPADREPKDVAAIAARIDPVLADPDNQPDLLVSRGELTVPIVHVWNHGDHNVCGSTPMACPLRNGQTITLGAADCAHENLRRAIAGLGPSSTSMNLPVCVAAAKDSAPPCDRHVVTTVPHGVNTDPASPADYEAAILSWVRARLAD